MIFIYQFSCFISLFCIQLRYFSFFLLFPATTYCFLRRLFQWTISLSSSFSVQLHASTYWFSVALCIWTDSRFLPFCTPQALSIAFPFLDFFVLFPAGPVSIFTFDFVLFYAGVLLLFQLTVNMRELSVSRFRGTCSWKRDHTNIDPERSTVVRVPFVPHISTTCAVNKSRKIKRYGQSSIFLQTAQQWLI